MERVGDRMGGHYTIWLANSIACCFPRSQERPEEVNVREEEGEAKMTFEPYPASIDEWASTTPKRQSPVPVSKYNKASVCYQQPLRRSQLSWPASDSEYPPLTRPPPSRHQPQSSFDRRSSFASKVSQRTRPKSRRGTNGNRTRPTISGPTNFRKSDASFDFIIRDEAEAEEPDRSVSPLQRRLSPFKPLQLSIYLPGKALPALPKFSDDVDDDDELPTVPGIERPTQALMKSCTEPLLTRQLTSFSIPRKPVGSRTNSIDLSSRASVDSGLTLNNSEASPAHKRSTSIDQLISNHRPSLSASRGAQEIMEIINAPLPPLPKPTATSHTEVSPTQDCSIYRPASDQNLRLRTHLEERQQSMLAFDTISEERSPVSPITPPASQISAFPAFHRQSTTATTEPEPASQIYIQQSFQQHDSTIIARPTTSDTSKTFNVHTWIDDEYELPLPSKARSSSGSDTLLNENAASAPAANDTNDRNHGDDQSRPRVITSISVGPTTPTHTLSQRLSQWLARSISSMQASNPESRVQSGASLNAWDVSYPEPLKVGIPPMPVSTPVTMMVTEKSELKKSKSAPGRKPGQMAHVRQQSSISTYFPGRELVMDVGVAF